MFNYLNYHNHLNTYYIKRATNAENTQNFIKEHIIMLNLFENMLGFYYDLNTKIVQKHNNIDPYSLSDDELAKAYVLSLSANNMDALHEACDILANNATRDPQKEPNITTFAGLLRSVYEAIPKMFYILHDIENAFYVLQSDRYVLLYGDSHDDADLDNFITLLHGEIISKNTPVRRNIGKDTLKRKINKFRGNGIYREIYTDRERYKKVYSFFSNAVHANVLRNNDVNNKPSIKTCMQMLADLCFITLYLYANASWEKTDDVIKLRRFIGTSISELKNHHKTTALYPTNKKYLKNLYFQPVWWPITNTIQCYD